MTEVQGCSRRPQHDQPARRRERCSQRARPQPPRPAWPRHGQAARRPRPAASRGSRKKPPTEVSWLAQHLRRIPAHGPALAIRALFCAIWRRAPLIKRERCCGRHGSSPGRAPCRRSRGGAGQTAEPFVDLGSECGDPDHVLVGAGAEDHAVLGLARHLQAEPQAHVGADACRQGLRVRPLGGQYQITPNAGGPPVLDPRSTPEVIDPADPAVGSAASSIKRLGRRTR